MNGSKGDGYIGIYIRFTGPARPGGVGGIYTLPVPFFSKSALFENNTTVVRNLFN